MCFKKSVISYIHIATMLFKSTFCLLDLFMGDTEISGFFKFVLYILNPIYK